MITENLLIEWTNLKGKDLQLFYLTYLQHKYEYESIYTSSINLEDSKKDIQNFLHQYRFEDAEPNLTNHNTEPNLTNQNAKCKMQNPIRM